MADPTNGFDGVSINDIGGSAAGYAAGQNAGVNNAFTDYLKASQSQAKPLDIYSQLESGAGLPQLRQTQNSLQGTVNGLEDSLSQVKNNVAAKTYNSLATEAQRAGMVNAESAPIQDNLSKESTSLSRLGTQIDNGESRIGTMTGLALQGEQMALDPYKTGITVAQDNAARNMTGFTTDSQNRLTLLVDKINRGDQISDEEYQQAQDLAKMQKQYQLELNNSNASADHAMQLKRQDPLGLL